MVLGFALGTERPKARGVLGVLLAMLGVGTIVYGGLGGGSLSGNLLVAGAAVCWGSYTAFSIFMLRKYSPLTVASCDARRGAGHGPVRLPDLVRLDWAGVGVSVGGHRVLHLFVAAFAFSAWQTGISRIGANKVLVYQYLIMLTGVVCGVLLLGRVWGPAS